MPKRTGNIIYNYMHGSDRECKKHAGNSRYKSLIFNVNICIWENVGHFIGKTVVCQFTLIYRNEMIKDTLNDKCNFWNNISGFAATLHCLFH